MTRDTDMQNADDLDAAITALLTHRAQTPGETVAPELLLVAAVADLSASLAPETAFAADLEARLLTAPDPAPPALNAGDGHNGHAGRNGHAGGGRPSLLSGPRSLWRWWLPLAAMLVLTLLLVPQAQAGIQTLIRIGAVRIGLVPQGPPTLQPGSVATPTPTPLPSPLDLAGATTLAQARAQAGFPLLLPAYPPDLGPPQHVFLQDLDGPMVALVWVDAAQPSRVRLALFEMSNGLFVYKSGAQVVAQTTVHGQPALWTEGPYVVQVLVNGQVVNDTRRLVTGHVLIWAESGVTYRLETDGTLDDAVHIAESLH